MQLPVMLWMRRRQASQGRLDEGRRRWACCTGASVSGRCRRPSVDSLWYWGVATVVGLVATLVGLLVVGPIGRNRLNPVLMQGGTLVVVAAGFFSMRRLVSARRRWFQVAVVATLALLWLVAVVGYLSDRKG